MLHWRRALEELQLTLTPSRVDQRNYGIMLANWRVGQTVNALVSDRSPSGGLILTVGSQNFVTSRDIPVQPGSRIQLEVQQTEPKLVLRLIEPYSFNVSFPAAGKVDSGTYINFANKSSNQLSSLLNGLSLNSSSFTNGPTLNLLEIRTLLLNNVLHPSHLNANAVHAAVMMSGIFTEAMWASNRGAQGAKSTKTILMMLEERITAALRTASLSPAERSTLLRLMSDAAASISKITHQQISSIPLDYEKPKWLLTLPLQLGEALVGIEVEIERRAARQDGDASGSKLKLSLTLETLGEVTVCIEMINGRLRVDLLVSESAGKSLDDSLPVLRNQLLASGLELDTLTFTTVETPPSDGATSPQKSLDVSV